MKGGEVTVEPSLQQPPISMATKVDVVERLVSLS